MIPYAIRSGYLSSTKLNLFRQLVKDVEEIPDHPNCEIVSCHAVCRALVILHPELNYVDGYFYKIGHDHSWIDMGDGIIADMYPIAASNPFLVDASSWVIPWEYLYIPEPDLLYKGNRDRKTHEDIARYLVEEVRKIRSS